MSLEITEKQFQDLPLVQQNRLRNPASFMYLAPGVQGSIRLDGAEYTGATNVITINGGPIWNTELLIEGLPGGQTRIVGNYTESSPPVDAVSEFKVTTTLLPADFGLPALVSAASASSRGPIACTPRSLSTSAIRSSTRQTGTPKSGSLSHQPTHSSE